jgi:hypothetical protein
MLNVECFFEFTMSGKAQITSVEALETFRAQLIVFLGQARPVLEEVGNEMARMRMWLQNDQRMFWEQELRRREQRLEEARQELFNATVSSLPTGTAALLQMTVQRSQRAVHEVEAKLKILKRWDNELDNRSAPLMKQIEQLHGFLASDMTRAVAYLDQALKALDAYRNVGAPAGGVKTAATEPASAEEPK